MNVMTKDQLADSLANYGYPLLMPESNKPEEVLENLLVQDDQRLLEGFPVVFLSALQEKEILEWETDHWNPNKLSKKLQTRLLYLLAVSFLLFNRYHVDKKYAARTLNLLHKLPRGREFSRKDFKKIEESNDVNFHGTDFSFERFRNVFETYVVWASGKPAVEQKRQALEQDLLLSELFTPCQKMLLNKKMKGKDLTKTEREYFSRVVKKRLQALANEDLHQLARRVLYQ